METANFVKKVLFKTFIMGYILLIVATIIYTKFFGPMYNYVNHFFPMSQEKLLDVVIYAMSYWKIVLFQFFLLPAIAIHITEKVKKEDKTE